MNLSPPERMTVKQALRAEIAALKEEIDALRAEIIQLRQTQSLRGGLDTVNNTSNIP